MWIQRTPEEVTRWQKATRKEARSHGLLIGVSAWIITVVVLSSGWFVNFQSGIAVPTSFAGTFWVRLPIFGLLASPIIFIALHYESKKVLKAAARLTICPQCDTPGDDNAGASCGCDGTFVPQCSMKWVEK